MNGKLSEDLRDPAQIRRKRESNKMFGLNNRESWSGYKLLVDFLETLFNNSAPSIVKLEKPVSWIWRCRRSDSVDNASIHTYYSNRGTERLRRSWN
jgi:hypothetical protein